MGSIEKACISGFLCRLCSEMHRTVIHIYGDQGQRLCLVEKINGYLPITISPTDPLPKTICKTCLHRVEQHYSLLMRLTRMREERKLKLLGYKARVDLDTTSSSLSSVEFSEDEEQGTTGNTDEATGGTAKETSEATSSDQPTSSPRSNTSNEVVASSSSSSRNQMESTATPTPASTTTGQTTQELSPMP
ncbi:integrator complex subunit 6 homolog [Drosophila tropicalis]|uniref:integrator complex subunit 6 homolog n=1 Tax=Drosophila tropicalis TaxID=46794 RepID=UPI0035AB749A